MVATCPLPLKVLILNWVSGINLKYPRPDLLAEVEAEPDNGTICSDAVAVAVDDDGRDEALAWSVSDTVGEDAEEDVILHGLLVLAYWRRNSLTSLDNLSDSRSRCLFVVIGARITSSFRLDWLKWLGLSDHRSQHANTTFHFR